MYNISADTAYITVTNTNRGKILKFKYPATVNGK